jgi:L-Ala-D/L-Glu epimerase
VWRLLGAPVPEPVQVNWTIASADRAGAAGEAAQARAAGFRTLKCKVAIGDDHGRLAAVRAIPGPQMAIRELGAETEIPLALDESAADPEAFNRQACALICLKVSRCGGLSGLLEAARAASAAGYEVFLASTLDGPLGIAAALHAAALPGACGLATLPMFEGRGDPLPARGGLISVPSRPGLGGLESWYQSRRA